VKQPTRISVVAPCYNEPAVEAFVARTAAVLDGLGAPWEIVCVDDGSTDDTWVRLRALAAKQRRLVTVRLTRNFGKEVALTAGLDFARGEVVVPMDADLQDPPDLLPALLERWREGYDVVYAVRRRRRGEPWAKRLSAYLFYRVLRGLTRIEIPADAGDFRLLSRRAVDALRQLRERHRFMKGLMSWIGFRQTAVEYERGPRATGRSSWSYWRLWNFALEGITSFSFVPLKLATYLGFLVALGAFGYAVYRIVDTLLHGNLVKGYPSLMVVILFLGGVQLVGLGVIGEYVGRISDEVKQRPLYLVDEVCPAREEPGA
jgi:glycosyltransferase involved in cell wall biosynthesis